MYWHDWWVAIKGLWYVTQTYIVRTQYNAEMYFDIFEEGNRVDWDRRAFRMVIPSPDKVALVEIAFHVGMLNVDFWKVQDSFQEVIQNIGKWIRLLMVLHYEIWEYTLYYYHTHHSSPPSLDYQ